MSELERVKGGTSGTITHVFPFAWPLVSLANWYKYPNERRPDLVSVDILARRVDPATGRLHIRRLLIIEGLGYPDWLKRMIGSNVGYFVEDTVVDRHEQVLEMRSRNLTFDSVLQLEETCRYEPAPSAPAHTLFTQTATVKALPYGLQSAIEYACSRSFQANAHKGRSIMHETIERVERMTRDVTRDVSANLDRFHRQREQFLSDAERLLAEQRAHLREQLEQIEEQKRRLQTLLINFQYRALIESAE